MHQLSDKLLTAGWPSPKGHWNLDPGPGPARPVTTFAGAHPFLSVPQPPRRRRRRGRRNVASAAMSATTSHDVDMAAQVHPVTASASTTPPAAVAADATSRRKEPPPEKPSDSRRRSVVILSFWLIVLCLGLPIWWRTTTIPRASLPLDDMMDWAVGKVRRAQPFNVTFITHTCLPFMAFPCPQHPKEHMLTCITRVPGLPTSLSPSHIHPGEPSAGPGGPELAALDPTRPG